MKRILMLRSCLLAVLLTLLISLTESGLFFVISSTFPLQSYTYNNNETAVQTMARGAQYGYTSTKSRLSHSQIYETLKQYSAFDSILNRKHSFTIPGLENTFTGKDCQSMVPQGICIAENYFLTTAYDAKQQNFSTIYVISNDHRLKSVIELPVKIHAGGIAFDGKKIWVCGDDEYINNSNSGIIYSVDFSEIKNLAENSKKHAFLDEKQLTKFYINNSASFCTYYAQRLWVGTFTYFSSSESTYGCMMSYDTNAFETSDGTLRLNHESFLILPNRSQGVCFIEANDSTYMILSRSYARNKHIGKKSFISEIRVYKPMHDAANPQRIIKKGNAICSFETPPMIEELCFNQEDNMIYAIFESGASKYSTDNLSPLNRCKYIFDKIAAIDLNLLLGTDY